MRRRGQHRGPYLPPRKSHIAISYDLEEAQLKQERQAMRHDDERIKSYKKRLWIDPESVL